MKLLNCTLSLLYCVTTLAQTDSSAVKNDTLRGISLQQVTVYSFRDVQDMKRQFLELRDTSREAKALEHSMAVIREMGPRKQLELDALASFKEQDAKRIAANESKYAMVGLKLDIVSLINKLSKLKKHKRKRNRN